MIEILTLGPRVITLDGAEAPAELQHRKNFALLVYLARSPGRMRSREHLVGLFWPDKPEDRARHSLREAIRILRNVLGEDGLEVESDRIRLADDAVHLDIDALQQLVDSNDSRGAAELVRGEFLEGFTVPAASVFEDWLGSERLHWRGRSVAVLMHYAEESLAQGNSATAIVNAQRAHTLDPGSPAATRVMLRGLALQGDRAQALDYYQLFQERLQHLGAEPDTETAELAERVRGQKVWKLPASVTSGADTGAESRRTPLVGRSAQLGQLLALWEKTRNGTASICCIAGDSGVGKTRLAEELLTRASLDGATTVTFRAVESDQSAPNSGVLGLARGGVLTGPGLAGASPTAVCSFAQLIPEWADRFQCTGVESQPIGLALTDVLRAISLERPVFLFLDDAEWCDGESLLMLSATMRDLAQAPILLCITATATPLNPELDRLRAQIGRQLAGTAVMLEQLQTDEMRRLVEWAVPSNDDDQIDRLTRRVTADSAGFPLLAVELLHAIALGLDLDKTKGVWPEPLRTLSQTLPSALPDAIAAAIRVGFWRLSKPAQHLLATAAILGGPASPELLGHCTDLGGSTLDEALDELEWRRWLSTDARGYSFVATIIQQIVSRDMVTEGQRQRVLVASKR